MAVMTIYTIYVRKLIEYAIEPNGCSKQKYSTFVLPRSETYNMYAVY
jgi:hypothetical protein